MRFDEITLNGEFGDAIITVTDALAEQGFGIITRIDMHDTFKTKLGVDFPQYTILGACNPQLALNAVSAAPEIGLLLPCNVTVENTGDNIRVRLPDAIELLGGGGTQAAPALKDLAEDAAARLTRVATVLRG